MTISREQLTVSQPERARGNLASTIQRQPFDSCSPDGSDALDLQTVARPAEMNRPSLSARVEERCGGLPNGIPARREGLLLLLTGRATQRQIREQRCTSATLRNHVVERESKTEKNLRRSTVLATMLRTHRNGFVVAPKVRRTWRGHQASAAGGVLRLRSTCGCRTIVTLAGPQRRGNQALRTFDGHFVVTINQAIQFVPFRNREWFILRLVQQPLNGFPAPAVLGGNWNARCEYLGKLPQIGLDCHAAISGSAREVVVNVVGHSQCFAHWDLRVGLYTLRLAR